MKRRNQTKRILRFTIVEMISAMAIFSILMLLVMQIFGTIQDVCTESQAKVNTANEARTILNMISSDLQSAVYNVDYSWCYYQPKSKYKAESAHGIDQTDFMSGPEFWVVTTRADHEPNRDSIVVASYWLEQVPDPENSGRYLKYGNRNRYQLKVGLFTSNLDDYTCTESEAEKIYSFKIPFLMKPNNHPTALYDTSGRIGTVKTKKSAILSTNILRMDVIPYSSSTRPNTVDEFKKLPWFVIVRLVMVDDTESAREKFAAVSGTGAALSEDEKAYTHEFTRLVVIERGQKY